MRDIDTIKTEIEQLEAEIETAADQGERPEDIEDDDPEVTVLMTPWDDQELAAIWRPYSDPKPLIVAKRIVGERRRMARLLATATNESLPMPERIQAACEWTGKDNRYWNQFPVTELPERLSPHPHTAQLKELADFIEDRSPMSDVDEYVKIRVEAVAEFNRLKNEYPKRNRGTPILIQPEERVAHWAKKHDPEHGITRSTYCWALRQFGFNV